VTASTGGAGEKGGATLSASSLGLPFRPGVRSGGFLYLAGAIGNEPGTRNVRGDVAAQTRRTLANLGEVLGAEGLGFEDVVSVNAYLTDAAAFPQMNQAYRSQFPSDPPSRVTVEAQIVIPQALVEISMIAALKETGRKPIRPEGWRDPAAPYSWGILAGDTLFISGMLSRDPRSGQSFPGDVATQTQKVLENIGGVLRAAGLTYKDIVANRVFLPEVADFSAMNEVYRRFFPEAPPARATVRAGLMSSEFKVKIQTVAVAGANHKVIAAEATAASTLPLSPAIQASDRLFLSGMLGKGPEGWEPDVRVQTRRTLSNLQAALRAAGMDFSNVVDATVYLTEARHFAAMNEVYAETIPQAPPARATVVVGLMAAEALVEILMTAAVSQSSTHYLK